MFKKVTDITKLEKMLEKAEQEYADHESRFWSSRGEKAYPRWSNKAWRLEQRVEELIDRLAEAKEAMKPLIPSDKLSEYRAMKVRLRQICWSKEPEHEAEDKELRKKLDAIEAEYRSK